jgi:hypothetical protein
MELKYPSELQPPKEVSVGGCQSGTIGSGGNGIPGTEENGSGSGVGRVNFEVGALPQAPSSEHSEHRAHISKADLTVESGGAAAGIQDSEQVAEGGGGGVERASQSVQGPGSASAHTASSAISAGGLEGEEGGRKAVGTQGQSVRRPERVQRAFVLNLPPGPGVYACSMALVPCPAEAAAVVVAAAGEGGAREGVQGSGEGAGDGVGWGGPQGGPGDLPPALMSMEDHGKCVCACVCFMYVCMCVGRALVVAGVRVGCHCPSVCMTPISLFYQMSANLKVIGFQCSSLQLQ